MLSVNSSFSSTVTPLFTLCHYRYFSLSRICCTLSYPNFKLFKKKTKTTFQFYFCLALHLIFLICLCTLILEPELSQYTFLFSFIGIIEELATFFFTYSISANEIFHSDVVYHLRIMRD